MKKILLGLFILIMSIGFTGCMNAPVTKNKDGVIVVTLDRLLSDYNENSIVAEEKYEGQKLQISGEISYISKLKNGGIEISITTNANTLSISAEIGKGVLTKNQISRLKSGNMITIQGTYEKKSGYGTLGKLHYAKIIESANDSMQNLTNTIHAILN